MIRTAISAWYGEAEADGSWAALVPSQHVLTNTAVIPLCPGGNTLFLRKHGEKLVCQGHQDGRNWLWGGFQWSDLGPSYGVSPVAFAPDGTVVQNTLAYGSQGIRWIDETGVHTGDATYVHPTIPSLYEFTTHGDITVGQGGSGGAIVVVAGKRVMLEPGYTVFIRFNRVGDSCAFAIVKQGELVLIWATKAELAALPEDVILPAQPTPVPTPTPTPKPEPVKPMAGITDAQFATLVSVRAKYGTTLNEAEIGALLNEVAWIHRAEGVGLQAKPSGTGSIQPRTGIRVWNGLRFAGDIGQDVLSGASIGVCTPVRGAVGPADPATFVAPVEPLDTVVPNPGPIVPNPSTTGSVGGSLDAALAALGKQIADLKAAVSLQGSMIAGIQARLDAISVTAGIDGARIALRTDNGHYVVAEGGGGGAVNSDRTAVGGWETFTIETQ